MFFDKLTDATASIAKASSCSSAHVGEVEISFKKSNPFNKPTAKAGKAYVKDLLRHGRRPVGQVKINDIERDQKRLYDPLVTSVTGRPFKNKKSIFRVTIKDS